MIRHRLKAKTVLRQANSSGHGRSIALITVLIMVLNGLLVSGSLAASMVLPKKGQVVPLTAIEQICLHYDLPELWQKIARDPPPRPFSSDGCTAWFDRWRGHNLYPACFLHDLKYWSGYPGEDVARLHADSELMLDVADLLGGTLLAEAMFQGVRVGGVDQYGTAFSWGFGRKVDEDYTSQDR